MNIGKDNEPPTQYEIETYEGRKICEAEELGYNYCPLDLYTHVVQMRNKRSSARKSATGWRAKYTLQIRQVARDVELNKVVSWAKKNGYDLAANLIEQVWGIKKCSLL